MKLSVIIPVYNQEKLISKAIDSVPDTEDIEIIIVNDGSTDNTQTSILNYLADNQRKNKITTIELEKNKGVSYALNRGLEKAIGNYIVFLGSDDWFIPGMLEKLLEGFYDSNKDLIYFDLETNDGTIFHLEEETKRDLCGSVKLMKRSFLEGMKVNEEKRAAEDLEFNEELLKRNPTEIFSNLIVKHYNFPREGSLYWNYSRGLEN